MDSTNRHRRQHGSTFRWLAATVIVGLSLGSYLNSLTNSFVLADRTLIENNPRIRDFSQAGKIFFKPTAEETDNGLTYRPLAVLSFAVDYSLWRLRPSGYHQTNVVLHALCAVLAYWLALRVTGRGGLALAVAALFAVHPVAATAVDYVSNRGTLLVATFGMGSLCLFAAGRDVRGPPGAILLAGSVVTFALAMWSGEVALVVPVLLVAYLLAVEAGAGLRRWLSLCAHAVVLALYVLARNAALGGWSLPAAQQLGWLERAALVFRAIGGSVVAWVAPGRTQIERSVTEATAALLHLYLLVGLAAAAAIVFLLCRGRRATPEVWFGAAWVAVASLPAWVMAARSGRLPEQALYLPSIGVSLMLCAATHRFLRRSKRLNVSVQTIAFAVSILAGVLMFQTFQRNRDWRSETKLLAQLVLASPRSAELRARYAQALARSGRVEEAIRQYRIALEIRPANAQAHTELAIVLGDAGRLNDALRHFREAARLEPNNAHKHFNLAVALGKNGQFAEAIRHYRLALSGPGLLPAACNNLAWLLATCPHAELRNGAEAVQWAQRALQIVGAQDPDVLDTLAAAHAEAGNFDEAARLAQEAAQIAAARGKAEQAAQIRSRLKLYLARQPYRESP